MPKIVYETYEQTIERSIRKKGQFDMDFLLFCGLTQKNELFNDVLEYIMEKNIYIHVHFLSIGDISLIDELFS